jgi:hypothetical protein
MPNKLKFFKYEHLPEHLQKVSKPFGELAQMLDQTLPDGAEKDHMFHDLLAAKDHAVRAILK